MTFVLVTFRGKEFLVLGNPYATKYPCSMWPADRTMTVDVVMHDRFDIDAFTGAIQDRDRHIVGIVSELEMVYQ